MLMADINNDSKEKPVIVLSAMDEEGSKKLAEFAAWAHKNGKDTHTCFLTLELQISGEPLENFGYSTKPMHKIFLTKLD